VAADGVGEAFAAAADAVGDAEGFLKHVSFGTYGTKGTFHTGFAVSLTPAWQARFRLQLNFHDRHDVAEGVNLQQARHVHQLRPPLVPIPREGSRGTLLAAK
jgi:hypothetical protein